MRGAGDIAASLKERTILLALLALLLLALLPLAALAQSFPPLTGRVVDAANLLKPEEKAALEARLKAHEDRTSDQVVVATVPTLGDLTVEDYANRLFRHWQLGQKKTNNGVLVLVAPQERKIRIEVGYGLEGALTDALSKVIITTAIAPQFQKGDFPGGIEAGIDAILSILTGDAEEWQRRGEVREDPGGRFEAFVSIVMVLILMMIVVQILRGRGRGRRHRGSGPWIVSTGSGSGWSGGGGSWSSGSGGGFSGRGGSSGGGGASGGW